MLQGFDSNNELSTKDTNQSRILEGTHGFNEGT
jgi:hypothetical protein